MCQSRSDPVVTNWLIDIIFYGMKTYMYVVQKRPGENCTNFMFCHLQVFPPEPPGNGPEIVFLKGPMFWKQEQATQPKLLNKDKPLSSSYATRPSCSAQTTQQDQAAQLKLPNKAKLLSSNYPTRPSCSAQTIQQGQPAHLKLPNKAKLLSSNYPTRPSCSGQTTQQGQVAQLKLPDKAKLLISNYPTRQSCSAQTT